jgi:hypothetical protein
VGLAPFSPEPHLIEKLRSLAQGTLRRPIDLFDLFLHAAAPVLLGLRLGRLALSYHRHRRAQRPPALKTQIGVCSARGSNPFVPSAVHGLCGGSRARARDP